MVFYFGLTFNVSIYLVDGTTRDPKLVSCAPRDIQVWRQSRGATAASDDAGDCDFPLAHVLGSHSATTPTLANRCRVQHGLVITHAHSLAMPRVYPPIEGRQANSTVSPSLIESAAGFSAGIVSTLAVHPFDVIKTRLQGEYYVSTLPDPATHQCTRAVDHSSKAQFGDTVRIVKSIAQNEGSYLALYRGLMPNMIGNSVSWALYFLWQVALTPSLSSPSSCPPLHRSSCPCLV